MSFSHRPTGSKQQNKPFKTKHRSKGELKKKGGKVERESIKSQTKQLVDSKNARKSRAKQIAQNKRSAIIQRSRESHEGAPRLIAIVGLTPSADVNVVKDFLLKASVESEDTDMNSSPALKPGEFQIGGTTVGVPRFKTRLTFFPVVRNTVAVLDIAKVADTILFITAAQDLVNAKHVADSVGLQFVGLIQQQGLPGVMFGLQGLDQVQPKMRQSCKNACSDFCNYQLKSNKVKVLPVDTITEANQLLRFLCEQTLSDVRWRSLRPYMLVDKVSWIPYREGEGGGVGGRGGTLLLSGYLRGDVLQPHNIVHVTGYGDAQLEKVTGNNDPYPLKRRPAGDVEMSDAQEVVLSNVDPALLESLERENTPDPFASEQTWPTPEELAQADEEIRTTKKKVPPGTSSYQAAWIPDLEGSDNEGDGDHDEDEDNFNIDIDVDKIDSFAQATEKLGGREDIECGLDAGGGDDDVVDDDVVDDDKGREGEIDETKGKKDRKEALTLSEEEEEDINFPDEIDTPEGVPARLRFQKFRGLKSFRTSPWDPKENLPVDYARIYQFQNFKNTYKKLLKQVKKLPDNVEPGQYITLHLKNISNDQFDTFPQGHPLILSGLHKYENKMSVTNFVVHRSPSYTRPIKHKSAVLVQAGFRRYLGYPLFSENTLVGDKFKRCKFFRGSLS
eukprot:TRINITY_DN5029_c0_g1_i12.p1 TRINITY_DN5029_c0_g1~~TRINITY_DN5029_c0_g1_i12.p1  ORF type:complete len:673 (+),score=163.64 TRINITY_DN5029_c0_g1_i12:191-2209(+)